MVLGIKAAISSVYTGSRAEMLEVMNIDIELNAQGLEFWLEKRNQ